MKRVIRCPNYVQEVEHDLLSPKSWCIRMWYAIGQSKNDVKAYRGPEEQ
jgi:hypothetical protein